MGQPWILALCAVCSILCQSAQAEIRMTTRCQKDPINPEGLNIVCPTDETIWIRRAFLAAAPIGDRRFCNDPRHNETDHCTICEDKLSNDMGKTCNLFSNCKFFPECDESQCGQGNVQLYLHAEYECLPRAISNGGYVEYIYTYLKNSHQVEDRVFLLSRSYSEWSKEAINRCKVLVNKGVRLVLRILDLKGRLIDARSQCTYNFYVNDGGNNYVAQTCPRATWIGVDYTLPVLDEDREVDIVFDRAHQSAEGKLWLVLSGTHYSGSLDGPQTPASFHVQCGPDVELLPLPTTTTSSTTTSSTITSSTTTTTATTAPTSSPTTATTATTAPTSSPTTATTTITTSTAPPTTTATTATSTTHLPTTTTMTPTTTSKTTTMTPLPTTTTTTTMTPTTTTDSFMTSFTIGDEMNATKSTNSSIVLPNSDGINSTEIAAVIAGIAFSTFVILVVILVAVYCKNRNKRNTPSGSSKAFDPIDAWENNGVENPSFIKPLELASSMNGSLYAEIASEHNKKTPHNFVFVPGKTTKSSSKNSGCDSGFPSDYQGDSGSGSPTDRYPSGETVTFNLSMENDDEGVYACTLPNLSSQESPAHAAINANFTLRSKPLPPPVAKKPPKKTSIPSVQTQGNDIGSLYAKVKPKHLRDQNTKVPTFDEPDEKAHKMFFSDLNLDDSSEYGYAMTLPWTDA